MVLFSVMMLSLVVFGIACMVNVELYTRKILAENGLTKADI